MPESRPAGPGAYQPCPEPAKQAVGASPDTTIRRGLQAPVGTLPQVLGRLEAAMLAAFSQTETRARLREIGIEAAPLGTAAFDRLVAAEYAKWGEVVRTAGIRTD